MTEEVSNPNPEVDNQVTPQPEVTQTDPNSLFADQLASIVTDDGRQKYGDVPTALNSIPHAQSHINELTTQVRELEEELAKRDGMDELLARLPQSQNTPTEQPSVAEINETDIESVVEGILTSRQAQDRAKANATKVKAALVEKFGDSASAEFEKRASQLGISVQQLTDLSMQAPAAALELFSVQGVEDVQPTVESTVNIPPTPVPQSQPDFMAKFSGTDGGLSEKWAKAKAAVEQNLN